MEHSPEQPDAASQPTLMSRRYDVERSCLRCHERKVRCDKSNPCSRCLRAEASCRYPGPERIKRRSQRAKVVPRLEVLERAIAAINSKGSSGVDTHPSSSEKVPDTQGGVTDRSSPSEQSEEFLVKEGVSTRYINEALLSCVLEKVCRIRCSNTWSAQGDSPLGVGKRTSISH